MSDIEPSENTYLSARLTRAPSENIVAYFYERLWEMTQLSSDCVWNNRCCLARLWGNDLMELSACLQLALSEKIVTHCLAPVLQMTLLS